MSNNVLVCKDNRIIEASYRLTLREQRLVLLAISQINSTEKLNDNKVFKISASEYSSRFGGTEAHSFRDMKIAINQLYERSIKVIVDEDTSEDFRWISKKSNTLSDQSVEIRFTTDIAPYLNNLKGNFTKYHLLNISGMTSIYSIRIYEMLMQWKARRSLSLSIEQIKDRMQTGEKYRAFANIKQKVIDPAISEINEFSDITVQYELIKTGKKVTSVYFTYEYKPGMEPKSNKMPAQLTHINEADINKHARPGESKAQVINRLKKLKEACK